MVEAHAPMKQFSGSADSNEMSHTRCREITLPSMTTPSPSLKAARDASAVLEGVTPAAAAARTGTGVLVRLRRALVLVLLDSRYPAYPPLLQGGDTACHKATTHEARGGVCMTPPAQSASWAINCIEQCAGSNVNDCAAMLVYPNYRHEPMQQCQAALTGRKTNGRTA